jgi:hypothetical protein
MIDSAWKNARGSVTSETLYGLGLFFAEHGDNVDARSLSRRLGKLGFNAYISGVTDRRRANPGMSIATAAPAWTLHLYNAGRRAHRI